MCPVREDQRHRRRFKLQLHDAIYRLQFFSNSLTHILSLSNSHSNVASIQKNRGDKSHRVIVASHVKEGRNSRDVNYSFEFCPLQAAHA